MYYLPYGEYSNIKTNFHSTMASQSVVHFHFKTKPQNASGSFKVTRNHCSVLISAGGKTANLLTHLI